MKEISKTDKPWGTLTGIRPSRLYRKIQEQKGLPGGEIVEELVTDYGVLKEKAELISEIVQNQQRFIDKDLEEQVALYIHIPFCRGKCAFCAFYSVDIEKNKGVVEKYLEVLEIEIKEAKELIKKQKKEIHSIYIGGGTPTALDNKALERVLKAVGKNSKTVEYTVEAGKIDTISAEKCALLQKYGVNRICINPQSFNKEALESIKRVDNLEKIEDAFLLARKYNFTINSDVILGLPGENDITDTLKKIIKLRPENLTVHYLSYKKGSEIAKTEKKDKEQVKYEKIVREAGYRPYYLYRQKNQTGNLENIGYSLKGKECINNIVVMEEVISVIACGASAISKKVINLGEKIERLAAARDINLYIERIGSFIKQKSVFFT